MSNVVPLRPEMYDDVLFVARRPDDPDTSPWLEASIDHESTTVTVEFAEPVDASGIAVVRDTMYLNADQCEEFGRALLSAAARIRAADSNEQ